MNKIEREKLRMFDTGSNKRNKSRWVQLIEAERQPKRRGPPKRATKKTPSHVDRPRCDVTS